MVAESSRLAAADLVRTGYPFFVGRLMLEREVILRSDPAPDAVLELPPFAATVAVVHVNGEEAGAVWKAPRTVPVGSLLARGRNRVSVTLTTSLRNMLGPHHFAEGESYGVFPAAWAGTKGWFGQPLGSRCVPDDYNVVDFGLGGDVVLRY